MSPARVSAGDAVLRSRRLVAFAAITVAISLCFSNGHLDPFSLAAMTISAVAVFGAARLGRRPTALRPLARLERWIAYAPEKLLWFGIVLSLTIHLFLPPAYYGIRERLVVFRPLVVAAGALAWSYRSKRPSPLLLRARFPLLLALAAAMSAVTLWASPHPAIDVWDIQQLAAQGLAQGQNPYTLEYPNVYGGTQYLMKEVLSADGSRILWNPYVPLTLLLGVPSMVLAHDVRWTMVACTLFSAWAIRRLGSGARAAELASVLLLVQPRAFFVIEQSWTDPTLLASLMLTLLASSRWIAREAAADEGGIMPGVGAWVATGLAAALLAASKQYSPILLVPLFLALPERGRWKAAGLAVCGAAAIMLPFLFWNPSAFFNGVVRFQFLTPFREDALSWPAALAWLGGPRLPPWPAFAFAGAVLVATLGRRVSLVQAVTAGAVAFMVLLLLNKQAFCNYYWLAGALLCASTALHARSLEQISEGDRVHPQSA